MLPPRSCWLTSGQAAQPPRRRLAPRRARQRTVSRRRARRRAWPARYEQYRRCAGRCAARCGGRGRGARVPRSSRPPGQPGLVDQPAGRRRHYRRRGDAGQGIPRRRLAGTYQRRGPAHQVAAATGRQLDQRGRAGASRRSVCLGARLPGTCVSRATRPTPTIWPSGPAGSGTPADGPRLVLLPGPGWLASGSPGGRMRAFPLLKVFISLAGPPSPTRTPTGKAVAGWPRCR